jgi:hypothetical protein
MNEINKHTIIITFDSWMPFSKELQREIDDLLGAIRGRRLLGHAGNVKTLMSQEPYEEKK